MNRARTGIGHALTIKVLEGASHEVGQYGTLRVIIPRHSDINELTARGILRDIEEAL